ncbi:MAG: hypothetical protein QW244_01585 [Candidatus Pacearchaeota archaeon]
MTKEKYEKEKRYVESYEDLAKYPSLSEGKNELEIMFNKINRTRRDEVNGGGGENGI